ncbi:hypothetical protein CDAR_418631 [Caerostris darwini]|uniref:Uncharacterized protein n=1 Tax=Caerostris darwini TaxID=1538125 RepID=A0AAV4MY38_9ARAC|nr:hypothetical protein CDAR_418631 [Caerostris darwini]
MGGPTTLCSFLPKKSRRRVELRPVRIRQHPLRPLRHAIDSFASSLPEQHRLLRSDIVSQNGTRVLHTHQEFSYFGAGDANCAFSVNFPDLIPCDSFFLTLWLDRHAALDYFYLLLDGIGGR